MTPFEILAALLTLAAVFSWINHRFIRMPATIGIMFIALVMSLVLIGLSLVGFDLESQAEAVLVSIDFNETLLNGMLSFLLFAGALHIDLDDLAKQKWVIAILATAGLLFSTVLVGFGTKFVLGLVGIEIALVYALLFGALISPTDPIAVLGIMKHAGAPKNLETKVAGESLFNDGVGVVVFMMILEVAGGGSDVTAGHIAAIFVQEALGGALFGFVIGSIAYRMLKSVDQYQVEVLVTLALVTGGYALADTLHLSGPIAIVVAGLLIGNHGRLFAMSAITRDHLDKFWELVDEVFNAVLFVLIGLEILVLKFTVSWFVAGLVVIPVVLAARFISAGLPVSFLRLFREMSPGVVRVLTWGGLRGGISVALALSIPPGRERDLILAITYSVVVFSILVQGLTIGPLVKQTMRRTEGSA